MTQSSEDFGYPPKCYYPVNIRSHHCVEWGPTGECIRYVMADGSPLPPDINGSDSDCVKVLQYIVKNLNVIKSCKNSSFSQGCIPAYKGNDTVFKEGNSSASDNDVNSATSGCANVRENNIRNNLPSYVLADGTIIIATGNAKLLAVDVNGNQGPNKWGYDVHSFMLRADFETPQYYPGGCEIIEKGGKSTLSALAGK